MARQNSPLIALAAGGTGGHIFPAEATAAALVERGYQVCLITDRRGSKFNLPGVATYRISADTLRAGVWAKLQGIWRMGLGLLQAQWLLRRLRPVAVIGFGGYPSVPTVYAAATQNIPIILHEQNAVLGRANRTLLSKAKLLATSFPHVAGLATHKPVRMVQTGNPVRPAFAALRDTPYPALAPEETINLLVIGGSLAATIFADVIPQALHQLPDAIKPRLRVAMNCRPADLERARNAFAASGIDAECLPFIPDVPARMAKAHLIISRAGASTIAELSALGRPAILVPYPFGHADEQLANAEALAEAGGAWIMQQSTLTADALAVRLASLFEHPGTLAKTAAAAKQWGTANAAQHLAQSVAELLGQSTPGTEARHAA